MNSQFCKIGKTTLNFNDSNVDALELKYRNFVEQAYNLRQTDASLSDVLYFEATKIKRHILRLKKMITKPLDAAI